MSITDIIVESFKLYKNNFKRFFVFMVLTFVPGALVIISKFLLTNFFSGKTLGGLGLSYLVFLIVALLLSAISFWCNVAFIRVIAHAYTGQVSSSVGTELSSATKIFWPAIGVTILTVLAVLGGMILLIIPGIIFMLWFAFSYASVTIDNTNVMDGMHKSKALVDGRWWKVLWRLFFPTVVFGIVAVIAANIVEMPLTYILKNTAPTSSLFATWSLLAKIIDSFTTAIFTPLTTIAMVVLYFELKKDPQGAVVPQMAEAKTSTPLSPPTKNI